MPKKPDKSVGKSTHSQSYKDGAGLAAQHPSGAMVEFNTEYEGPLPSPELMKQYMQIDPQLPAKIIEHFETEQSHRQKWENELLAYRQQDSLAERAERRRGQLMAFWIAIIVMLLSAMICITGIVLDNTTGIVVGGTVGGLSVVSLVTAFLVGRNVKQVIPKQPPSKNK
jgi:uncharacterized membrane protein